MMIPCCVELLRLSISLLHFVCVFHDCIAYTSHLTHYRPSVTDRYYARCFLDNKLAIQTITIKPTFNIILVRWFLCSQESGYRRLFTHRIDGRAAHTVNGVPQLTVIGFKLIQAWPGIKGLL